MFKIKKLLIYFFVASFILIGSGYIYNNYKKEKKILVVLETRSTILDNWLVEKKKILNKLSKSLGEVQYDKKVHLKLMQKANIEMKTNSVFSGFENGRYFDTQGYWIDGFDPRTRPWYEEAFENNRTSISGPMDYMDISGQKVVWWAVSTVILKKNKPFGVVGSEILPVMLRKYLKEIYTDKIDHIFLFHKKTGLIISAVNRNKELKYVQNIFSEEFFEKLLKKEKVLFSDKNISKVAYTSNLKEAPWILCLIVSK